MDAGVNNMEITFETFKDGRQEITIAGQRYLVENQSTHKLSPVSDRIPLEVVSYEVRVKGGREA